MGSIFRPENVHNWSVAHTGSLEIRNATVSSIISRYKSAAYHSVSFRDEAKFGAIYPLT